MTLVDNKRITDDICILRFDRKIEIEAGQFIFLWIPGLGEKPFSALTDDPFQLAVINLGEFTEALMALEPGTEAYVRGPHGNAVEPAPGAKIMAVAGGTGLAAVYQLARDFGNTEIFFGARSAGRLYFLEESMQVSELHIATDDGNRGHHGVITELLEARLGQLLKKNWAISFSTIVDRRPWCGPLKPLSDNSAARSRFSMRLITGPNVEWESAAPVMPLMAADSVLTDLFSTPVIRTKVSAQPTAEHSASRCP